MMACSMGKTGLCSEVYPDGQTVGHGDSTCVHQSPGEMIVGYTASSKVEALGVAFPLLGSPPASPPRSDEAPSLSNLWRALLC